ncbi:hypothetical protein EBU58_12335 [bacterium]|nr:hypothetical protein [bacterium]
MLQRQVIRRRAGGWSNCSRGPGRFVELRSDASAVGVCAAQVLGVLALGVLLLDGPDLDGLTLVARVPCEPVGVAARGC